MIRLLGFALIVLLSACGDDDGSGPTEEVLTGTWSGDYTNTASPEVIYVGELQLSQNGQDVTGTLTTNAGRSATVSGSLSGDLLEVTFTYTDACGGTASSEAELVDERIPRPKTRKSPAKS